MIPFVMNFLPKIDPWDCSNLKCFCISSHENYMPRLGCEKWKKWCKNGNKMENSLFFGGKKGEMWIRYCFHHAIWNYTVMHSPYILVYPLLTYLLVSVPSILTLRYSGSQVWEEFLGVRKVTRSRWLRPFQWNTKMDEYVRNPRKQFSKIQWSFLVPIQGGEK